MKERVFTAIYEQEGEWFTAYTIELRGAYGQGRTLEEARESLREAIVLVLEEKQRIAAEKSGDRQVLREEIAIAV